MRSRIKLLSAIALPLLLIGAGKIDWRDMLESDWIYGIATRFSPIDGNEAHYPTPTAELARLLETSAESAALRHLAEAKLALGDRKSAWAAMSGWAEREGASAWFEAARWAMAHNYISEAFKAAEKAIPGLDLADKRALCDERVRWADTHGGAADPIALSRARSELFPSDANALEAWLRRLESANRLDEADRALAATNALDAERKLLLRSDLRADRKKYGQALKILDDAALEPWSIDFRMAYAVRVNQGSPGKPNAWRTQLENAFDGPTLIRLCAWFQGQGRGDAATDLIRQMERRFASSLSRDQYLLLSRLYAEVDAIPESFRTLLAASHLGDSNAQLGDLARLAHLALLSGSRPLSLGVYNDEAYRWAAQVDRTPGFWTGAVSFFLTGASLDASLNQLELESLPGRTFATALALEGELARRSPQHKDLPALRVALMTRHVDRGEGESALALLPLLENTTSADEARKIALMAAHQSNVPIQEELRLMRARLKSLAPDGSRPALRQDNDYEYEYNDYYAPGAPSWKRIPKREAEHYSETLSQYTQRLDYLDESHQTSVSLILGEMDRMPDAEALWMRLSSQLESWRLDDALGPRYVQALQRFKGESIWPRLARWYAKRSYNKGLRELAETLTSSFRGVEIFARIQMDDIHLAIPEQPPIRDGVRMVPWADWVRFKALERFPHSPRVGSEAQRLVTQSVWRRDYQKSENTQKGQNGPVVIPDALMRTKQWAIFFVDADVRELWFQEAMKNGALAQKLEAIEAREPKTPVDDMILREGWSRLSRYERAVAAAERLSAAYPGDESMAAQTLSLYRSLGGLGYDYTKAAHTLVARAAPALESPYNLWTELGEMEEELGRPDAAILTWQALLEREPRSLSRVSELAALLWDYNHDREALNVIEDGRKKMNNSGVLAFEAGVLWENLQNINRAMDEYMNALRQDSSPTEYSSGDQRAVARIAQLITRRRVYSTVERNIQGLRPGQPDDERRLLGYFPLAFESAGRQSESDDWIDFANSPNDPVGRDIAARKRADERPASEDAMRRVTNLILAKAESMSSKATGLEFLESCQTWVNRVASDNWKPERLVSYENTSMARRAELADNAEDRIRVEMERADFLVSNGRGDDASAVWSLIETLIASLPDGVAKMKTEAARASFLERSGSVSAAAAEWKRLGKRYPWSYGLFEDHLAFLRRTGAPGECRALLEDASSRAAEGFRLPLLQQLARQCLSENDNERALAATRRVLLESGLSQDDRLETIEILARLSIRNDKAWDPVPFVREQSAMFDQDHLPDMYRRAAIAADSESAHKTALWMWIEALNRRLDRQWLQSACRSAMTGGVEKELLSHFERQRQRSPRDVRWAVAARDICRNLLLIDETIVAAKAAVSINPSGEELWREAAEIMVLADKVKEAADYLEGWHKPRQADENVAAWRSRLYASAGESELAFAVERATLDAFQKITTPASSLEFEKRRARAAVRLMGNGLFPQALRIYSRQGDILAVTKSEIPNYQQVRLAMRSGQLIKLLHASTDDLEMLGSIANQLDDCAKAEDRESVIKYLLPQLSAPSMAPRVAALKRWHGFIRRAGLSGVLRLVSAQEYVSVKSGPWQSNPPAPFLQSVGEILIPDYLNAGDHPEPNLEWLWAQDLARRDSSEELLAFIQPAWLELMDIALGNSSADSRSAKLENIPGSQLVMETWARAAAKKPEIIRQLNSVMSDERLWDRFQALAPRAWRQEAILIDLVTPETRAVFSRFGKISQDSYGQMLQDRLKQATEAEKRAARGNDQSFQARLKQATAAAKRTADRYDQLLQTRQNQENQTTMAIGRLIFGGHGAADDPIIAKLRGPQTIGELLSADARWVWSEFMPLQSARGDIDNNYVSAGVDAGRFPAALWSQNPSEPWYVLETLARYRKGDRAAPLLPLESKAGSETDRILLSVNIAKSMGDIGLALELDARRPISGANPESDARRAQTRVQLLNASGEHKKAVELWKTYIISRQKVINSKELTDLTQFANRNNLPDTLGLLDASQPLHPELMASLVNANLSAFGSYKTPDVAMFRYALSMFWLQDEASLNAAQVHFWLRELWATGSIGLPYKGMMKLGGLWPHACQWLSRQPVTKRLEMLNAVEAGGEALIKPLRQSDQNDDTQILTARTLLAMGDSAAALAILDRWIAENRQGDFARASALSWQRQEEYDNYQYDRPLVDSARLWAEVFNAGNAHAEAAGRLSKMLKEQYENGTISNDAWALAFDLCAPESKASLFKSLDRSWFMGQADSENMGGLVETLVKHAPQKVPVWLRRWSLNNSFQHAKQRASIFVALKQPREAAKVYSAARQLAFWSMADDLSAFNEWRRLDVGSQGPDLWQSALKIWKGNSTSTLAAHLKAHPLDCYSAVFALETAKGASEDEILRVEQSIRPFISDDGAYSLLRLKAARHWLPASWRTASQYINGESKYNNRADTYFDSIKKLKPDDINSAMGDIARIYCLSGDTDNARAALGILQGRKYAGLDALRTELDRPSAKKIVDYQMADGRPVPILPKDMTWALLNKILEGRP
jgi:hypothetical protein